MKTSLTVLLLLNIISIKALTIFPSGNEPVDEEKPIDTKDSTYQDRMDQEMAYEDLLAAPVEKESSIAPSPESNMEYNMISIDISKTSYNPQRLIQVGNIDNSFFNEYNQQVSLLQKSNTTSLVQQKMNSQKGPTISLENQQNMGYQGKFWFGSPLQEMSVLFDAGSAQSWLFSEHLNEDLDEGKVNKQTLVAAKSKGYSQSKSMSFHENKDVGQEVSYGQGKVMGHPSEDHACFDSEGKFCFTSSLSFLSVVNFQQMSPLKGNGVIGLAPTPASKDEMKDPLKKGVPGFVAQLKDSQPFDPVFSIYLSNDAKSQGKMTFGGYDMKLAKEGKKSEDVFWFNQSKDQFWSAEGTFALNGQKRQFIFDNGLSHTMVPKDDFKQILLTILPSWKCFPSQPLWSCQVNKENEKSTLPPLTFNIKDKDGNERSLSLPESAFIKKSENKQDHAAWLLLQPWDSAGLGLETNENAWVLGDQFLQNYYSIYDAEKKQIGLVESSTSKL